jgi:serine/threonine-protein kinase
VNDVELERATLVRELFDEVADLDDAARVARLAGRGVVDRAVLAELDALIAADRQTGDRPLLSPDWLQRLGAAASSRVGQRTGDYRLTELLGSGGMGDVYLAERAAGDFDQKVAIKLVRRDLASPAVTRRFTEERRILARLRHPSIATMFGGGLTGDGRPYLVMEFVDGVPIDRHCRERALPIGRRVELVIAVCRAVAHAHAQRTVHCDLKPDNVLVTADGEVKLLDFGIATALEGDATRPLTALTPSYAAPEVLEGEPPSTAADVFSLGVLLYRVVTGALPHPLDDRGFTERAAMLRTTPVQPLTASADLEAICRRAMAPAPEDRYASAAALAEDLERMGARRPVEARRRTPGYVAGRFVRRHTLAVSLAALVAVAIAVLVVVYTRRLAGERDRARAESARAQAVSQVAVDMLTGVDPSEVAGAPLSARELLLRAEQRVDTALAGYPDEQERLRAVLSEVHRSLGHHADSERLARAGLAAARRRRDDAATADRLVILGDALREQTKLDEAEAVLREALALVERHHGRDSVEAADGKIGLASVLLDAGQDDEALRLSIEALAIHRARGAGPAELARALGALQAAHLFRSEYALAEPLAREALAASIAAYGEVHPLSASFTLDIGDALRHLGHLDDAEPFYRRALELRRTLYPGDHADVAHSLNHLARLLFQQGKPELSEPRFREALAMRRRLYPGGHAATAHSLAGLAFLLLDLGRAAEAEPLTREAHDMIRALHGDDHPYTVGALASWADAAARSGDRASALSRFRESLVIARRIFEPGELDLSSPMFGLGQLLCAQGSAAERREGRRLLEEAAAIYATHLPAAHPAQARTAAAVATCDEPRGLNPPDRR